MTTAEDFTTRVRREMFSIYEAYQVSARRVADLADEVTALGGAEGIYSEGFPEQGDGFSLADMGAAFDNLTSLVPEPSLAEKQTIIRCRRD